MNAVIAAVGVMLILSLSRVHVVIALIVVVTVLYRVSLPSPLPTHRLVVGAVLATAVFLIATFSLRFYLTWITATGYTYGALATPIAFLPVRSSAVTIRTPEDSDDSDVSEVKPFQVGA